jgi:hypothetical protein
MTRDHHQPNDHAAWSTPSPGPAPWSSTTPATYPGRACGGLVSTCSVSCSPANRPAPWRWTSVPCRPGGEEARSRCAGEAAAWAAVEPACEPGTANAAPSLPVRSGSGRRPSRPRTAARRTHCANGAARSPSHSRVQRGTDSAVAEPGHRRPFRPDTWVGPDAWTPDAWTPDVGSTDRTDVRTADSGRGHGHDQRGRRPDILATGDHPLGGQTRPGRSVWAARPPRTAPR